ncbi:MAG: hypothetical protein LBG92_03330 [Prevotellaceae bacterium]|jgi:hypothetical protein|nr:hypothetical protein [Prevotellaceae bacterium]
MITFAKLLLVKFLYIMYKTFFVVLALSICLSACKKDDKTDSTPNIDKGALVGTWEISGEPLIKLNELTNALLTQFNPFVTETQAALKTVFNAGDVYLFEGDGSSGKLTITRGGKTTGDFPQSYSYEGEGTGVLYLKDSPKIVPIKFIAKEDGENLVLNADRSEILDFILETLKKNPDKLGGQSMADATEVLSGKFGITGQMKITLKSVK